jgi:uncharacterized protein YkwD
MTKVPNHQMARWLAAATLAVTAALTAANGSTSYADTSPSPSPAPAVGYSSTGTWQLMALVNRHRHAMGLPTIVVNTKLAAAARTWTERMARSGNLAHNDALFSPGSHRSLGMKALGENVGWNYSVSEQDAAFLNSTHHRANIDTRSFIPAGFAVVRGADGRIWSTEDFGTPSS